MRPPRFCSITACPNTQAERDRIDAAARAAEARWLAAREARGGMTEDEAQAEAHRRGWEARQEFYCDRSRKRRAVRVRVGCTIWTKVRTYKIPGLGSGQSFEDAVYAPTWEAALRMARCRAKLREINARAGARP